jgi:hypothetical protein
MCKTLACRSKVLSLGRATATKVAAVVITPLGWSDRTARQTGVGKQYCRRRRNQTCIAREALQIRRKPELTHRRARGRDGASCCSGSDSVAKTAALAVLRCVGPRLLEASIGALDQRSYPLRMWVETISTHFWTHMGSILHCYSAAVKSYPFCGPIWVEVILPEPYIIGNMVESSAALGLPNDA